MLTQGEYISVCTACSGKEYT